MEEEIKQVANINLTDEPEPEENLRTFYDPNENVFIVHTETKGKVPFTTQELAKMNQF